MQWSDQEMSISRLNKNEERGYIFYGMKEGGSNPAVCFVPNIKSNWIMCRSFETTFVSKRGPSIFFFFFSKLILPASL